MNIANYLFRLFIMMMISILVSSCAINTVNKEPVIQEIHAGQEYLLITKHESVNILPPIPIKLLDKGKHLYNILIRRDKKVTLFKKIKQGNQLTIQDYSEIFLKNELKQTYDSEIYELIKVYSEGIYPSYEPNTTNQLDDTIFKDTTFKDVKIGGTLMGTTSLNKVSGKKIISENKNKELSTIFDKQLFLQTAKVAVQWVEENTKFKVRLKVNTKIDQEYTKVVLLIDHKPSLKIKKVIFVINGSKIVVDLDSDVDIYNLLKKQEYTVGIPYGKNRIKVLVEAETKELADDKKLVLNQFKQKPTLHMVAIGINKFPNLPNENTLINPINDANLVKNIFNTRGNELFNNKIRIKPYNLDYKQTTKKNIEQLIEDIRKNVKPNDYFIFYVASHGIIVRNNFYFAPSDFNLSLNEENEKILNNGFGESKISEYLINIPTIFRMAILDTCYSGKQVSAIKQAIKGVSMGKKEGISVLTAAKDVQTANDDYHGHGLFTYILAQGLEGKADYNNDKVVDSIEIAQYVIQNVSRISEQEQNIPKQDAVVFPEPAQNSNRRFELTLLKEEEFTDFKPNVFTAKESELYIYAIDKQDSQLMNGIIRNNQRHKENNTKLIPDNKLSKNKLIKKLSMYDSVDISINFDSGKWTLKPSEMRKLEIIAKALKSDRLKNKRVLLEGHTDSDIGKISNMKLSQNRAKGVTNLLVSKFAIDKNRLNALGFGEIYPIADNSTKVGKTKNRRVSVFIYNK